MTNLNVSNATTGTLSISRGGIGTTTLSSNQILSNGSTSILQSPNLTSSTSNQILLGNGTNPINQSSNLLFDTTNNRLGICKSQPNYTLDVSGNINANYINLQNLSNPNNTTIAVTSEPTTYNSKLILGSGYIGTNPANSFSDISTCQIIAKRNLRLPWCPGCCR